MDGFYDEPENGTRTRGQQQLYIDATSWRNWYYVSFDSLLALRQSGDADALDYAETHFRPYPIPLDSAEAVTLTPEGDSVGVYTYWYDVFGRGLTVNHRTGFRPTAPQAEPARWDIAFHRQNVRTNGGAALRTGYTDMAQLPDSSSVLLSDLAQESAHAGDLFHEDEFSQNEVWTDNSRMLDCYIGNQGIRINRTLSSWLVVMLPPIPPSFTHDRNIYIVRTREGRYAALQLANYMSPDGTKCFLTINYRYPY